jgi:hypothetical protein
MPRKEKNVKVHNPDRMSMLPSNMFVFSGAKKKRKIGK